MEIADHYKCRLGLRQVKEWELRATLWPSSNYSLCPQKPVLYQTVRLQYFEDWNRIHPSVLSPVLSIWRVKTSFTRPVWIWNYACQCLTSRESFPSSWKHCILRLQSKHRPDPGEGLIQMSDRLTKLGDVRFSCFWKSWQFSPTKAL